MFDPDDRSWTSIDLSCPIGSGHPTVEAGGLLIDREARVAIDPLAGACFTLPTREGRISSGDAVWTGTRLLYLSGKKGESSPELREAQEFVPSVSPSTDS
jgi:hypothetical protein